MKITRIAIRRPITTIMLFIILFVLGLVSINRLNKEMFPNVNVPAVAILTIYPGAGPLEVEEGVTKPIEDAAASLGGVTSIKSTSSESASAVTVRFEWDTNMDTIIPKVREKLNEVTRLLPEKVNPPTIFRFNPEMLPALEINIYSSVSSENLRELAEEEVLPVIEQVDGVADVDLYGGKEKAVLIECSLDNLSKSSLPLLQLLQVFKGENINLPGGSITDGEERLVLRTLGKFESLQEIRTLVVGYHQNKPIYLENIAEISIGFLPQEGFLRVRDKEGISISVRKQPGKNTVKINREILRRLHELEKKFPPSVSIEIQQNQAEGVNNAIRGVTNAAWMGGLLAIAVLFLFLGTITSTLIISMVIPVSIVASFSFMYISGVSINITSLMGITLAVGMFVDNAIVVLESIHRKAETVADSEEAAALGTEEVGMAVFASTITTLSVFLPMLLVSGLSGLIVRDIALTITFSLLISLFAAFTLTPMLSARLKKRTPGSETNNSHRSPHQARTKPRYKIAAFLGRWKNVLGRLENTALRRYKRALLWTFHHTFWVILVAVLLLAVSVGSVLLLGMEFLPETDEGTFSISYKTKPGSSYSHTEKKLIIAEEIILDVCGEDLRTMSTRIGSSDSASAFSSSASHRGKTSVLLVEKTKRKRGIKEIISEIDSRFKDTLIDTDISIKQESLSSLGAMASGESSPVVLTVRGTDLDMMRSYGNELKQSLSRIRGTRNVRFGTEDTLPEIRFTVQKKEAAALGISPAEIGSTIRTAYKGAKVTTFTRGGKEYDVVLMLNEEDRNSISKITQLTFATPRGDKILLENVVSLDRSRTPGTVERMDRSRVVKVLADLSGEAPLSKVMDEIRLIEGLISPPRGIQVSFDGAEQEMTGSFKSLTLALLLAVFLVYAVMASQFESLLHPLIVMFSVPFAVTGMIGALLFTGTTFNMLSFVGTILLVGLVVNNAIVLIDYINQCRKSGIPLKQSVVLGGMTRLRPILMTTLTTMLGLLPLALGIGSGSELQSPMGKAVLGGLAASTAVTLFFIPALYYGIEKRLARPRALRFKQQCELPPRVAPAAERLDHLKEE
jgi:hydrophobic/amphiphilic exporter-1 (mainly G- bacteria), HAE1 family